jgi:uncharacterized membrane protein
MLGLDALRGVAVFLMIEQHMGVWLWSSQGKALSNYPALVIFNSLGGGAAPLFIVLAGIGSSLLAVKRTAAGRNPDLTLIKRGVLVMGFGYLLNFFTPSWFSPISWFVLHLMGLGMIFTPILRRIPLWALLSLAAFFLLASGPLRVFLDTPLALRNPYMAGRADTVPAWAPLRIALAEGQFPIFPWMSLYVIGVACGRWIVAERLRHLTTLGVSLLALGGLAVMVWQLGVFERPSMGWHLVRIRVPFFPAGPSLVCLIGGGVLLGIRGMLAWDRWRPLRATHPLVTLGRASLTLLILHVILFRELSRPIGLWRALEAGPAMGVLWGFVFFAVFASWLWQRADYRFGAEWLLRRLAR